MSSTFKNIPFNIGNDKGNRSTFDNLNKIGDQNIFRIFP